MNKIISLVEASLTKEVKNRSKDKLHWIIDDNEVEELVYLGKAWFRANSSTKDLMKILPAEVNEDENNIEVRKFMIRRKRHLEMMYTNGVIFWT